MRNRAVLLHRARNGREVPQAADFRRSHSQLVEEGTIIRNHNGVFPCPEPAECIILLVKVILGIEICPHFKGINGCIGVKGCLGLCIVVVVLSPLEQQRGKGQTGFCCGGNGGLVCVCGHRRQHQTGRHIVPLERREHVNEILPRLRRTGKAQLAEYVLSVEHHRPASRQGHAVGAALILIRHHRRILVQLCHIVIAVHLGQICQQAAGRQVYRDLAAQDQCHIRPLVCQRCFHNAADYQVNGNRHVVLLLEFRFHQVFYHLCLISSQRYPYFYCVISGCAGQRAVVLIPRGRKPLEAVGNRVPEAGLGRRKALFRRGNLQIVDFQRLIPIVPHPGGQGRDIVLDLRQIVRNLQRICHALVQNDRHLFQRGGL